MSAFLLLSVQAGFYLCSARFLVPRLFEEKGSTPASTFIIFNSTMAVSATLLTQIICEILNLFSQPLFLWKANLWMLMLLVTAIIPFFLFQSILSASPRSRPLWLCFIAYAFLFWRLKTFTKSPAATSLLTGIVSRAGIVGVTLMAAVSGYGSVLTPMQLFYRRDGGVPITAEGLNEYQQRCQQAAHQLQMRRHEAQSSKTAGEQPGWLMKRVNWLTGSSGSKEEEVVDLEMAVDAMNDEYERLKTERSLAEFEKSAAGRVWRVLNHVIAAYSIYRIMASLLNVLLGRAGEADPVSVACGLFVRVFADWDVRLWAKEISFLFVGGVIVMKVTRSNSSASQLNPSTTMILSASLLAGLYITSTLLMLRLNLPPAARPLITQALEGIEFDFFERCFDFMYLAAAGITGLYIYMTSM